MRDVIFDTIEQTARTTRQTPHLDNHSTNSSVEIEHQRKRTNLLIWLGTILNQLADPDMMVQRTAELLADALPINCWLIVKPTISGGHETSYAISNGRGSPLTPATTAHLLANEVVQAVYQQAETNIIVDLAQEAHWQAHPDLPSRGSALILAVRHQRTPLGILLVQHPTLDYFRVEDILLMQSVAAQLGTALNTLLQQQVEQQRREHMYNMLALSRSIAAKRSFADLVQIIREYSFRMFGTRNSVLFIQHPTNTLVPVRMLSGRLYLQDAFQHELVALASQACETGQMHKQHLSSMPDLPALALPLIANGQQVGVLTLIGDTASSLDFPASTWSLLTVFTNTIAAACTNLLLQQEQQQHLQQLEQQVAQRTHQLQASRDALRSMVDTFVDGMLLLDADETVLVVNRAFSETILGRHPREVVGMNYEAIWDDLEQRGLHLTAQRSSDPNAPHGQQMYAVKCRNAAGTTGWYLVKRDPIRSELGVERYLEYWESMA